MAPKRKLIDPKELPQFADDDAWERFQGLREILPPGTDGLPDHKLVHVTVSGSDTQPRAETKYGVTGDVVMGYDVFRHDPKDAPFEFNKDHYFIVRDPETNEYWLHGPYRKLELDHWLEEIPDSYSDCEVLVSRKKPSGQSE